MPDWWLITFSCSVMINFSTKCLIVQSCIIMCKTVYYLLFPSWGPIISLTLWPFLSDLTVSAESFCRIRILISILICVPALSYLYANEVFFSVFGRDCFFFFLQFFLFLIVFPCSFVPPRLTEALMFNKQMFLLSISKKWRSAWSLSLTRQTK